MRVYCRGKSNWWLAVADARPNKSCLLKFPNWIKALGLMRL